MPRFTPYLGILAALAVGAFVVLFPGAVIAPRSPEGVTTTASSTLFLIPAPAPAALEPEAEATIPPPAELPKAVPPVSTTMPASAPVVSAPVSAPAPPPPLSNDESLNAAASALRSALVNIVCYAPLGSGLHSISGSGVIIDSKGIILTNAHIAQYFLLADRNVSCDIRSGSPASGSYGASLIYIPSAWLRANATVLTKTNPTGTGEYDFALLAVTKSISRNALPASFPFIPLATAPPLAGTPVVIASYGAQFLETSQVQSSLFPTIVFGSVKEIFTFATNTIDVLALGGSVAAQEGSSGGGVADGTGELVGTITTSTTKGPTDTRALDAITASYIRAAYASETGQALDILLSKSTATTVNEFATRIPELEAIITAKLP